MSSLALIDAVLCQLGGSTEEIPKEEKETTTTTFGDDSKSTEEYELTLRGIPEYENYPFTESAERFLFMADIKAPLFKKTLDRTSIDLCCVIDSSGSMSGDRIDLVKETVAFIINNLEQNDRFGIITFANVSKLMLPLTKMDDAGKAIALKECKSITATGNTALCDGLMDGIKMLKNRDAANKNKIASVMLFTDGRANKGITNKTRILQEMDKYMMDADAEDSTSGKGDDEKQVEGQQDEHVFSCSINTFGFGKNHNESLLEEIGERGNGMYSFIETTDLIAETFAEALGGLVSVCAQNLFVKITALNKVQITQCLSQRFRRKEIKKNEITQVIIPDIQSEEQRSLLFELRLPATATMGAVADWPIIDFEVDYNNTITNKKEGLRTICTVNRIKGELKEIGERNLELDIQHNRIIAANAMEKANRLAENSKLDEARKIIKTTQEIIRASRSKEETYCATLLHDLEQCLTRLVSHYEYRTSGRQYMMSNCSSHWHQRSTQSYNVSNISQAYYRTSHRAAMIQNFSPQTTSGNPDKSKNENDKNKKDIKDESQNK